MSNILKAFRVDSDAVNAFEGAFWYLILDKNPEKRHRVRKLNDEEIPRYEHLRQQYLYWVNDFPFVQSYVHQLGSKDAFGGAKVTLKMRDGSTKEFKGDLWSAAQWLVNPNIFGVGVATRRDLKECYVFHSMYIDKDYFSKWIEDNPDKVEKYERGKL